MSSILPLSSPPVTAKSPETNDGTVTQWISIPTAFPSQDGCDEAIISAGSGNLTGWDPGYAITVDASVKCWPSSATWWWNQGDPQTTISLGPAVCPEAYYTATSSIKDESSTLIACCPSNYAFRGQAPISIVAPRDQCLSPIEEGQAYGYASDFGGESGWLKTWATATATTSAVGVPFNAWQFKAASTAAAIPSSVPSATSASTSTAATNGGPLETAAGTGLDSAEGAAPMAMSVSAKVGIGVGVGIGVLMIIVVLLWIFFDPLARYRRGRVADRVEAASRAQGRGPSPPPGPPTPPSLRELAMASPTPPSLSPSIPIQIHSPYDRSKEMSPISSGAFSISGPQQYPLETIDTIDEAAPAPVIGGMGVGRSGSAMSNNSQGSQRTLRMNYTSRSNSRNQYSNSEWIHGGTGMRRPSTSTRPGTSASKQSSMRHPGVGIWGIDPTGRGGRADPPPLGYNDPNSPTASTVVPGPSSFGHARSGSQLSEAGTQDLMRIGSQSPTYGGPARSSSVRSNRVVMSPLEIAGQKFDMALDFGPGDYERV